MSEEENEIIKIRRDKLNRLRKKGVAFPNRYRRDVLAASLHDTYGATDREGLAAQNVDVSVAGR